MERRQFLKMPLVALGATGAHLTINAAMTAAAAPAVIHPPGAIKGVAHGGDDAVALRQLQSLRAGWYYSWASAYTIATSPEFVPMVYSTRTLLQQDAIGNIMRQLPETKATHLLGFNEPDHPGQSNISVDEAIRLWPHLQSTGLRLGSPGTVNAVGPWLDRFMTKAKRANLRIDFITVHRYASPNVESFLAKLRDVHAKYERPIWVTEFAVADWAATPARPSHYTGLEIRSFMRGAVAGMRAMPFVERFAWKTRPPFDPVMGASALYHTDGRLTATGRLYASL